MKNIIIKFIDTFYFIFKSFMPLKTYRYAACGGGNLVLDIILYFIFYNFIIEKQDVDLSIVVLSPHIAALFVVFPITFTTGFLLNKYITFEDSNLAGKTQLIRYFLVAMGAIIISYLLMKLFVDMLGFYPTVSKILSTAITVVYSYILQNFFTFKVVKNQQ